MLTVMAHQRHSCEYGSAKYYFLCGVGGVFSCGMTHTLLTPLDLVKCRIQVDPKKYRGIIRGFRLTIREDGVRGLAKGWAPTAIGYSMQGFAKFGCYEFFKKQYARALGEEKAYLWRTFLYLAASGSADFIAGLFLCPMEACKVRIQTQPGCPPQLRVVAPMILRTEGLRGFYKGIVPLWSRQIPYTMMKFATFERTVEFLYRHAVTKPRDQCSKALQLLVTFSAGYIAGFLCVLVSHPADTINSKLNQNRGSSAGQVLKKLGFFGLWQGLTTRILMSATLTAVEWFIYDGVKIYLRLPRPPPPRPPHSLKKKSIVF